MGRPVERTITRRGLLRGALLGGTALAVGGQWLRPAAGNTVASAGASAVAASTETFYAPPVVWPTNSLTTFQLIAEPGTGPMGGLVYNGSIPGPTFEVHRGQNVNVELLNHLDHETITHWHGMEVPHSVDGHPNQAVPAGGIFRYDPRAFVVDQRATMNWYHPHPHMKTGEQVALGMAGAFIIRDDEERALLGPGGSLGVSSEIPIVIRDADFDQQGKLIYKPTASGWEGRTALVNGVNNPLKLVAPGRHRLRVLGGSNGRIFRLAWSDGRPFTLIGNDAGLFTEVRSPSEIQITSGERLDLLLDLSGTEGDRLVLRDLNSGWDLMTFELTATGSPSFAMVPSPLSVNVPPLLSNQVTGSEPVQEFSFDGMGRINGVEFEMDRIDAWIPQGQLQRWRFTTGGNAPHPVHIHGTYFQVISRTGGRASDPGADANGLFAWEREWKDTVLLHDGETIEILLRFDKDYGNPEELYLLHCHKLEHEDRGMMLNILVNDGTPWQPIGRGKGRGGTKGH